ncbi:hypothetical protein VTO42DRAFT_7340 [Malbranchea cinnamomea]
MERQRTLTEIKLSFIRDQIRTLSAPLTPNPDWRNYYGLEIEEDISDKVVDDALQKLNNVLKQHHRAVFSTQATHHVVQQIERLYWDSINSELNGENSQLFEKGTDFSHSKIIARLPDQWPDTNADKEDKARYRELRERLVELDTRRKNQEQRLAQYKQLSTLLEPFHDPQTNIQPNLVTRDGQLGEELDRMRMLVAKVVAKLNEADRNGLPVGKNLAPSVDFDAKLSALLDMT